MGNWRKCERGGGGESNRVYYGEFENKELAKLDFEP